MDRKIAQLNIAHYKKLLATEIDEARRQTLLRLLAEEETKFRQMQAPERKRRR